jgi:hypothetical protein
MFRPPFELAGTTASNLKCGQYTSNIHLAKQRVRKSRVYI